MSYHNEEQYDRLRCEFTAWLEKVIVRAKIDYIRKNKKYLEVISMDELSQETLSVCDPPIRENSNQFEFNDTRMERAFSSLTDLRRQVLILLYVEEKSTIEAAKELGCSLNTLSHNRCRALKMLKEELQKMENLDE